MTFNRHGAIGLNRTYYSYIDQYGRNIGSSPTIAQNATANIGILYAAENFGLAIPEDEVVTRPGDDGIVGAMLFPANAVPQGQAVFSSYDETFGAQSQGLLANTESNFAKYGLIGADTYTLKNLSILNQRRAQSDDAATLQNEIWEYDNWFKVVAKNIGPNEAANRTPAQYRYSVVANRGNRFIWNAQVSLATYGANNAYRSSPVSLPYRLWVTYYLSDGSTAESFTLPYKPVSADYVVANRVLTDGTTTSLTQSATPTLATEYSINISTGAVATGAAGAEDSLITVRLLYASEADVTA